jgi:MinD-like ATPase involved in chromosome partitioning or flagellar assembly
MAADRFVVLGLAGVRTAWFGDVARWATSATLPVDFVKVVSLEEARARLRSGRPFSALLVDAGLAALDRDLVELACTHGCAVVAADDGRAARPWSDLGVHAVLPAGFGPEQLLDALRAVSRPIGRRDELTVPDQPEADDGPGTWRGRLVAVTGAGGTGRSTLAMALGTGLGADPRDRCLVLLADLALDAHQALMHDAGDVVPGVLELVEAHRGAVLPPEEVRDLCFSVRDRGYDLLLGLRRHRDWTALRPRALRAALDGLCRSYRQVVADVDADVEGDDQCGSTDVEDRNMLARQALGAADLVLVVGLPGVVGVHAQLRVVRDLVELGVDAGRIVPVVNRAPRSPRARAEVGSALTALLAASAPDVALASSPVFVPERRRLAEAVRDGLPPPAPLVGPLVGAVRGLLDRARHSHAASRPAEAARLPVPVAPGSLGSWSPDDEAAADS